MLKILIIIYGASIIVFLLNFLYTKSMFKEDLGKKILEAASENPTSYSKRYWSYAFIPIVNTIMSVGFVFTFIMFLFSNPFKKKK